MSDKNMDDKHIQFDKQGYPTKSTMQWLFDNDRDKFLEFQDEYFTTKAKMKETPFDGLMNKVKSKLKGK